MFHFRLSVLETDRTVNTFESNQTDDVRIIISIIYHLNSRDAEVHGLYPAVRSRFILIRQVSAPYNA